MKNILIVVDMQNDFISGSLGTREAESIVMNAVKRLEQAKASGEAVIFTRDTHDENYMNTQEGRKLPVPHCIRGTHGHEICPELAPYTSEATVLDKPSFGSFELLKALRPMIENDTVIELFGLCTDICVVSNALLVKNAFPENTVRVNAGCSAGVTPDTHAAALKTMASCQIEIIGE